jgi:hypothetical protein
MVKVRTVLALDDLLARAVMAQLPGAHDHVSRSQMRDDGDDVVRDLVSDGPCALVIGADDWNPLDLLERWRLPYAVPIVMVTKTVDHLTMTRAARLRVFSLFAMDSVKRGLPTSIVAECLIAHAWRRGFVKRELAPVLVLPSHRPSPARSECAQVIRLGPVRASGVPD